MGDGLTERIHEKNRYAFKAACGAAFDQGDSSENRASGCRSTLESKKIPAVTDFVPTAMKTVLGSADSMHLCRAHTCPHHV